jgi:hypothetical protein
MSVILILPLGIHHILKYSLSPKMM